MYEDSEIAPPRRLAAIIRRQAWLVALLVYVAIALAWVVTELQTPTYKASMSLVVGQAGGDFQPQIGDQSLTQTMTTLLDSEVVASAAIKRLKLDTTPEKFLEDLNVTVIPSSSVLEVTYVGHDPPELEATLGEVNRAFMQLASDTIGVQSSASKAGGTGSQPIIFATVYNPPHADPRPISPRRGMTVATAGVLGLVLGLVLAFVRERLDDRVRSREEAEEAFGLPVIGVLPRRGRRPARRRELADALTLLSLNLEVSGNAGGRATEGATILVTSTQQEEGKSMLVANLALALARDGDDVVCVEADANKPTLTSYLDVAPVAMNGSRPNAGDVSLEALLQPVDLVSPERGAVAPGGRLRVLHSDRWNAVLAEVGREDRGAKAVSLLRAGAQHVIIDGAPLTMGDTSRLALLTRQVIVVARIGKTRRSRARAAGEILQRLGVVPAGVVLTDAKSDSA